MIYSTNIKKLVYAFFKEGTKAKIIRLRRIVIQSFPFTFLEIINNSPVVTQFYFILLE